MASNCACAGCGASFGGISPERTLSRIFPQVSRFSSRDDGVNSGFKFSPPDIMRSLWQSVQVALRTGLTAWLNAAGSVGVTVGFGAAAHTLATAAKPKKRMRPDKESLRFRTIIAFGN